MVLWTPENRNVHYYVIMFISEKCSLLENKSEIFCMQNIYKNIINFAPNYRHYGAIKGKQVKSKNLALINSQLLDRMSVSSMIY